MNNLDCAHKLFSVKAVIKNLYIKYILKYYLYMFCHTANIISRRGMTGNKTSIILNMR